MAETEPQAADTHPRSPDLTPRLSFPVSTSTTSTAVRSHADLQLKTQSFRRLIHCSLGFYELWRLPELPDCFKSPVNNESKSQDDNNNLKRLEGPWLTLLGTLNNFLIPLQPRSAF